MDAKTEEPINKSEPKKCSCCRFKCAVLIVAVFSVVDNVYATGLFAGLGYIANEVWETHGEPYAAKVPAEAITEPIPENDDGLSFQDKFDSCKVLFPLGLAIGAVGAIAIIPSIALICLFKHLWICIIWMVVHILFIISLCVGYSLLVFYAFRCIPTKQMLEKSGQKNFDFSPIKPLLLTSLTIQLIQGIWFLYIIIAYSNFLRKRTVPVKEYPMDGIEFDLCFCMKGSRFIAPSKPDILPPQPKQDVENPAALPPQPKQDVENPAASPDLKNEK